MMKGTTIKMLAVLCAAYQVQGAHQTLFEGYSDRIVDKDQTPTPRKCQLKTTFGNGVRRMQKEIIKPLMKKAIAEKTYGKKCLCCDRKVADDKASRSTYECKKFEYEKSLYCCEYCREYQVHLMTYDWNIFHKIYKGDQGKQGFINQFGEKVAREPIQHMEHAKHGVRACSGEIWKAPGSKSKTLRRVPRRLPTPVCKGKGCTFPRHKENNGEKKERYQFSGYCCFACRSYDHNLTSWKQGKIDKKTGRRCFTNASGKVVAGRGEPKQHCYWGSDPKNFCTRFDTDKRSNALRQ